MSGATFGTDDRSRLLVGTALAVVALAVVSTTIFDLPVTAILTVGFAERALQAAAPIALAAIGGLYADKSGVFDIGLEGFMIFGAVLATAFTFFLGGEAPSQTNLWLGILGATLVSTLLSVAFAVLLVRYRANQIVARLAVWFIGLGFGPFIAVLLWGNRNSPGLTSMNDVIVPGLSELPILSSLLRNC
jgi:simple sugar transport system permease protein